MNTPYNQSRRAFELHQSGHSLEQIAEHLNTSDDRASQLIAAYRQQLPAEPEKPWWHGLSPSNRVFFEELGVRSRADAEKAYQSGFFTRGHPNFLSGITNYRRKRILDWLGEPITSNAVTYPTEESITLRLNAERVRELEALCQAAKAEPSELVDRLISVEAKQKKISGDV